MEKKVFHLVWLEVFQYTNTMSSSFRRTRLCLTILTVLLISSPLGYLHTYKRYMCSVMWIKDYKTISG